MSVDTDDVKNVAAETAAGAEQNAASVLPDDVPAEVRTHWLDGTRSRELEAAEQELADDPEVKLSSLDQDMIRAESETPEEAAAVIAGEESRLRKDKALEQAAKLINQETPSRMLLERPAWGITGATGELHMRSSWAICLGRSSPMITGMYGFAAKVKAVIGAYRRGCPFAAQRLLKLEDELKKVNGIFRIKEVEVRKMLESAVRTKMEPFTSERPSSVSVHFISPYAYHAFELLLIYDDIMRIIFPYAQMGMIDPKIYQADLKELGRHIRRILGSCDGYYYVGEASCRAQDDIYQAAVNAFGEPDARIIEGKLLPYLVAIPQAFVR